MERAGDILRSLFGRQTADEGLRYHRLFSGWDRIVGTPLAGRSRVEELENGHLLIRLDHPGCLQLLRMEEAAILKRLKREFPDLGIKTVRGIVRPPEHREDPQEEQPAETAGIETDADAVHDALSELMKTVSDPRLRSALRALYHEAARQERDREQEG
jgi:hypothetical protein